MFVENDGGRPTPTGGAHEGVVSMVRFFASARPYLPVLPHLRKDGVFTQVGEAVFFFQMTTMVPIEPEMMMMMATKDGRTGKRW